MAVRPGTVPGQNSRRERVPRRALDLPVPADIGGGRPLLAHPAPAGKEIHRQQIHGGAAPGLSPQGHGRGHGLQGLVRVHPRPEKALDELGRLGALPLGLRAAPHAVAEQEEEHPVLPAEPGARVAADLFSPPGGPRHGGGGPEGLRLGENQTAVLLLPFPEGGPQDLGQLLPGRPGPQLVGDRGLRPQAALLVVVDQPAGQVHAAEESVQPGLPGLVRGDLRRELGRRLGHELVQPGVLAAQGPPGLPGPPQSLPPPQEGGELPVDRPQKLREMDAPVGKGPVVVGGQGPPPLQHGGGGVVACPPGLLVVLLPAGQVQDAFGAHLVCRPGEDAGGVFRVGVLGAEGLLHAVVEGVEGVGHLPHAAGNGPASAVLIPRGQGQRSLEGLVGLGGPQGDHQEENGPHHRLQGHPHAHAPLPGPQDHDGADGRIDHGRRHLTLVPAQAAGQPGQGEDHAAIGLLAGGQVQGHAAAGPHQNSLAHTPAGGHHDAHRRQETAHGKGLQNLHPAQGHEDGAGQHEEPGPLPG